MTPFNPSQFAGWKPVKISDLRNEVMFKMLQQQHEVELSEPGTYRTSLVGTDEGWWYRTDERRREAVLIHQDRQRRHFRESPVAAIKRRIALADQGIFPDKAIEVTPTVVQSDIRALQEAEADADEQGEEDFKRIDRLIREAEDGSGR